MKRIRFSRDTLQFPQKDFDMVKEGVVSLGIITVLIVAVAAIWGSPYRPAVTNRQVALQDPVVIGQTILGDLDGQGEIASYGPPYNNGWHGKAEGVSSLFGFAPQAWWGTPYHINTAQADVLTPLQMLATASHNSALTAALHTYNTASYTQQQAWAAAMTSALGKATVRRGQVVLPPGHYGPVALMVNDEINLAKSGLLSGALDRQTNNGVYRWNVQNDLLFLQGAALHGIANNINMSGGQWGINHDEQAYPGPWWLTPYTFLYQVPPWSTSEAGDQMAAYTMGLLFILLILLPWIPGLNKLPKLLPVHRVIWRDWYQRLERTGACGQCPLRASCTQEFHGQAQQGAADAVPSCYQPGATMAYNLNEGHKSPSMPPLRTTTD
ncbi:MAG: cytochrome B6 [Bacilli bacterium]